MKLKQLKRFLGLQVCLQFREPICLCVPNGPPMTVPSVDATGLVRGKQGHLLSPASDDSLLRDLACVETTWPIKPARAADEQLAFSLLLYDCVLVLVPNRGLMVMYKHEGAMLEMAIDPAEIVCATVVRGVQTETVFGTA